MLLNLFGNSAVYFCEPDRPFFYLVLKAKTFEIISDKAKISPGTIPVPPTSDPPDFRAGYGNST